MINREKIRFLAEWEPVGAVLMALPHEDTDWNYMLDEALVCYEHIITTLTNEGVRIVLLCSSHKAAEEFLVRIPHRNLVAILEANYNDTWTRDYGPLAVERFGRKRSLDFGFNGWGLKFASDKDNLVNLYLKDRFVLLPEEYRNERDFILEGGSVESDGENTVMTTTRCLTSPNRNGGKNKAELNAILADRLGASHVLWLDYGALAGDDTDSHIDTLARLVPGNAIAFAGCRNMDDEHFEELLKMRAQLSLFRTPEGEAYNLIEMPFPDPVYDEEGQRIPATYLNYLIVNDKLFMPVYDQPANDLLACQTIRIAFPGHKIIPVRCKELLCQHGSLHCATMQLHEGFFNDAIFIE